MLSAKCCQPVPEAVKLDEHPTRSEESERTRSMAISYVMLVLLPPVGVVLMFLNAFARPSTARTGLIAMIVLAILMVIGAYTFLNLDTKRTAALHAPIKIEIQPLVD